MSSLLFHIVALGRPGFKPSPSVFWDTIQGISREERRGEERRNDSVGHLQRTFLRRLCCPVGTVSTRPVDPLTAAKIWGNLGTSVRPLVVVCPNHFATTTAREDDDVPWFGRRNEYYKLLSFTIFNIPIACPYCRASDSGRRVTGVPCRSLRPC